MKKNKELLFILLFVISVNSPIVMAMNKLINRNITDEKNSTLSSHSAFKVHFFSYLQFRYSRVIAEPDNEVDSDYWSLRRFKLFAKGKFGKNIQFGWQVICKTHNNSRTDDKIYLQQLYLKYLFSNMINLKIGQFKPPFGWEWFQPDFAIPTMERSQAVNRLIPNGSVGESFIRDYGMQCFGKLLPVIQYELAVMMGSGANTNLTDTIAPLLVGRLAFKKNYTVCWLVNPVELSVQLAHSRRWDGDINFSKQLPGANKNIFTHFAGRDIRWDVAVSLKNKTTYFTAEYLQASFDPDKVDTGKLSASGWFVQLSHFLNKKWKSVVKYEKFDPDRNVTNEKDLSCLTVGLNYFFNQKYDRIMLGYLHKKEAIDEKKNDMIIVQLQYFLYGNKI